MTLTVDLVPHMDAGDRTLWRGDQNERPLSELGLRQAAAFADALAGEPVNALYSSPALRCQQSIEPLATRFGLTVEILPQLSEEVWRAPDGWDGERNSGANVAAFGAGSVLAAAEQIRQEHPEGHVVACSHGNTIPAFVAALIAAHDLRGVGESTHRGQWYRLRFEGDDVAVELREAAGFPS
ncbi:MAG: histidine phosphatase family protein [Dehalococcoidia bacterium]